MTQKKKGLSREQAMELYEDLQKSMQSLIKNEKMTPAQLAKAAGLTGAKAAKLERQMAQPAARPARPQPAAAASSPSSMGYIPRMPSGEASGKNGQYLASGLVILFAAAKVVLSALEAAGFASAAPAQATMMAAVPAAQVAAVSPAQSGGYSREEMAVLTALDGRRTELEERARKVEAREAELNQRDREFAAQQTQLKEMTEMLRVDREKSDKKRSTQLDQLANVYGSMDPKEAATLIEQLDVTIALSLLERMPEKRIGQILSLMSRERALNLTKLLSARSYR